MTWLEYCLINIEYSGVKKQHVSSLCRASAVAHKDGLFPAYVAS